MFDRDVVCANMITLYCNPRPLAFVRNITEGRFLMVYTAH